MESILVALISAGIPALATIVTYFLQNKTNRRHQAKQSILQEITEDKVGWYCDRKFPENQQRIQDEYDEYHKNGGNGTITRKVNEYFLLGLPVLRKNCRRLEVIIERMAVMENNSATNLSLEQDAREMGDLSDMGKGDE